MAELGKKSKKRPVRAAVSLLTEESAVAPAHVPGTTGRPTRERAMQFDEEIKPAEEAEEGAQMGTTRAVHVTRPNRKRRAA